MKVQPRQFSLTLCPCAAAFQARVPPAGQCGGAHDRERERHCHPDLPARLTGAEGHGQSCASSCTRRGEASDAAAAAAAATVSCLRARVEGVGGCE